MSEKKPLFGVLAGEPEIIGERCADGGKCHHRCTDTCSRRSTCAPLSGSGLRFDWSTGEPSLSAFRDVAGDRFEVPVAWLSGPAQDEREAPVVVATAILGGIYQGGSGPELGEIDIEVCMPALEALQCEMVNSSDDVLLPLMPVVQHERIVAALTRPAQTAPRCEQPDAFEVARHSKRLVEQLRAELTEANADFVRIANERESLRAEVETLRKDAERYRWASSGLHEAETLASIVHCHGGYAEKVAERVDVYREAAMAAKDPEPEHRMDAKVKAAAISLAPERSGRIYIAGPMTGLPDYNFPAFNDMAAILRGLGYHVENPAEHGVVEGAEWADYLRYDIARLATCEALVLLPGWRHSRGALLEVHIAKALGIQIMFAEVFSCFDAEEGA